VSNSTFWHESSFLQLGYQMTQCDSYLDMLAKIRPIQSLHGQWRDSPQFVQLKRLAKNEFRVTHRGCTNRKYSSGRVSILNISANYQNSH